MIDSPDSRPGHCQHLFLTTDVDLAASRALSWTPTPTPATCQLCWVVVDLTPHVSRAMGEEKLAGDDSPAPVRGWGTWRKD